MQSMVVLFILRKILYSMIKILNITSIMEIKEQFYALKTQLIVLIFSMITPSIRIIVNMDA
jgi:hypothetical protein